jgi:3-deoxy-D-manno-octulosonate 8-phosphate phosphatase (KDO 8-P phosphatase)
VDGVLTDGGVYLGAVDGRPMEFKRYDIQDGLGIYLMQKAGLRIADHHGPSVRERASACDGVEHRGPGAGRERDEVARVPQHARQAWHQAIEAAFVGDDFPDLAVLAARRPSVAVATRYPK